MKAYNDPKCNCYEIEAKILETHNDWNRGEACKLWQEEKVKLKDNSIEHKVGSNEYYSCTCPTCGRTICGWCA